MSYHSHKLNSTHSHIIGRTDPITGDSIQENDNVVFCTVCKSCFLEESWVYMNERHCEKNETLENAPTLPSKLIAKKRSEEMITELRNRGINFTIVGGAMILAFLISFFGLATSDTVFAFSLSLSFVASLFITGFAGVVSILISITQIFKKMVGDDKNDVRLFRNRIEIGNDSFSWNDIKQIKFQREVSLSTYEVHGVIQTEIESYIPILLIYFNKGKFVKYPLPTNNYQRNKEFLEGLAKISHFTEVFFYSENFEELRTINTIQSQSNGNIQVGEPRKIVDSNGRLVYID